VKVKTVKRIAAKMLATPSGLLAEPIVTLEGAHILEISTRGAREIAHLDYDFPDATITAGFFDIHFHGIAGQDVMNAYAARHRTYFGDRLHHRGTVLAQTGAPVPQSLAPPVVHPTAIPIFDVASVHLSAPSPDGHNHIWNDIHESDFRTGNFSIQDQLGLKLESGKGPVPVLVIDHVEPSSAN
jgi:uncharacterized protein DUF3738